MLRRLRRPLALAAPLILMAGVAAGCGDAADDNVLASSDTGFDAVSISGDVGSSPEVDWKSKMVVDDTENETLVEGDGEPLADGDQVIVNWYLGNGFTEKTTFDSFGEDTAGFLLTVGEAAPEPTTVQDLVTGYLSEQLKAGTTRGTRIATAITSAELFGNAVTAAPVGAVDIGNEDSLLLIADVGTASVLPSVRGAGQATAPWAPQLVVDDGVPQSLDFTGVPTPNKELLTEVLKKGDGAVVAKGDLLVANYLGQIASSAKPFDESYTGDPITTPIGLMNVVKGWDQALVGQTVGSRVLLQIPPALGYGPDGQGKTIPGGSTLYFVIDILAAG